MYKVAEHLHTRPPWERMMLIHERIQGGAFPNCSTLAKEIDVCIRTVLRDVDFMRDRLRLPIKYDDLKYGFCYTKPVEKFPSLPVTEAELFALLVAHKAIAQYHGTPFETPLRSAFQKLTTQLGSTTPLSLDGLAQVLSFRPFAPEDTDLELFEVLHRALQERREVRFHYRNLGTVRANQRQVRPYHLACIDNHWYLFAFDPARQDMRTFALTRMSRPELTDHRFARPKNFNPDEYLRGSLSVFKGKEDFEIVVLFDAWAADLIRGRQWHGSQEIQELPGRKLRMRMRLNNLEEMERWILSWGRHATVERPKKLIIRLREAAREVAAKYRE